MRRSDEVYLEHILDAISRIERHVAGVSAEAFGSDELRQDGVVRQLEIIGEASRQLSDAFRAGHAEVPWGEMVSLRNRAIHAYFDLDLQIIWEIVQSDLPPLKRQVVQWLEPPEALRGDLDHG